MVEKSHEPFIDLVLSNDHLGTKDSEGNKGRRYSRRDIEDFLNGDSPDERLSVCFQYWTYGDTGKVAKLLGAPAITDVESKVDASLLEGKAKLEARVAKLDKTSSSHTPQ